MKQKKILVAISIALLFVSVFFGWFLGITMPQLKRINFVKRDWKHYSLKLNDLNTVSHNFVHWSEKEDVYCQTQNLKFKERILVITDDSLKNSLLQDITEVFIHELMPNSHIKPKIIENSAPIKPNPLKEILLLTDSFMEMDFQLEFNAVSSEVFSFLDYFFHKNLIIFFKKMDFVFAEDDSTVLLDFSVLIAGQDDYLDQLERVFQDPQYNYQFPSAFILDYNSQLLEEPISDESIPLFSFLNGVQ
jgi:hypothetical protein